MSKKNNYQDSLQLPETTFPMRAELSKQEPKRLAKWQQQHWYQRARAARAGKPLFIVHDGPPYANGPIHLGHCVNKILKDLIIKSRLLQGMDVPMVPGWDCHGLPIEVQVEKKHGRAMRLADPKAFRQACRQYAAEQISQQCHDFQRLGVLADWGHPYTTFEPSYEAGILKTLAELWQQGFLKEAYKPTPWCLDCQSTLSHAEMEYAPKRSHSLEVIFPLVDVATCRDKTDWPLQQGAGLLIWTTTPWTLPANLAVAVDAKLNYVLIQHQSTQIIVAEACLAECLTRWPDGCRQVGDACLGQSLINIKLQHPWLDRQVPLLAGHHVISDRGTGAVHISPDFGEEDFILAEQHGIAVLDLLNHRGIYAEDVPVVGGMHIKQADLAVLDQLKQNGLLWWTDSIEHAYPCCWRHKTPLIYRATKQWFLVLEQGLALSAAKSLPEVVFTPVEAGKKLSDMVAKRPDWCLSRARTWGVPMGFLKDRETDEVHPRQAEWFTWLIHYTEQHGIDAIDQTLADSWLGDEAKRYRLETHTLDVWFEAGCSHRVVLSEKRGLAWPADVYLEGSDQHRGWFNSSLLLSFALRSQPPYRQLITHGYTVDQDGRKMSKSLGNVVAPKQIIDRYGADILRWWVASIDYHHEMIVSEQVFLQASEQYRRVRNTMRFLLANLHDFKPETHQLPPQDWLELDRWLLAETNHLHQQVFAAYESFSWSEARMAIYQFCSETLGKMYLDLIKDRQYTFPADSASRRSAQTVMWWVLRYLVHAIMPILSFTADEVCECAGDLLGIDHIIDSEWPKLPLSTVHPQWNVLWRWREHVHAAIEHARQQNQLGGSLSAQVTLNHRIAKEQHVTDLKQEWKYLFLVSKVVWQESPSDDWVLSVQPVIDLKCERCWHHDQSVGSSEQLQTICQRCWQHMHGQAENRVWI